MGFFSKILPIAGAAAGGLFGGPAGAALGGGLGGMFGGGGGERNRYPEAEANQYFNQINQRAKETFDPYIQRGHEAQGQASEAYQKMLSDPTGFVNAIMQSYQPSKGYEFKEDRLRRNARANAAAGGFAGTNYDTDLQNQGINGLLEGDIQQYLANILGVQGKGLEGQQHVANLGQHAAGNQFDYIANNLLNQGNMAYSSAFNHNARSQSKNDANNSFFQNLLGFGLQGADKAGGFGPLFGKTSSLPASTAAAAGARGIGAQQAPMRENYRSPLNRPRTTAPGAAWDQRNNRGGAWV